MRRSIGIAVFTLLMTLVNSAEGSPQEKREKDTVIDHQNDVFYDSVYRKLSRNRFTQTLYGLAFVTPPAPELPDSLQVIDSQIPFIDHKGKIIRRVKIQTLAPFGPAIYDTGGMAITGIGKFLNGIHVRTRDYVIRRNLLFHPGQELDPFVLADNERVIKDLSPVDDARIIVEPVGNDSVDILVVAKDVWSIGLDIPLVTFNTVGVRLYDANFLGIGDRLTLYATAQANRSPFLLFQGGSYQASNMFGTFTDGALIYNQDDLGNQILGVGFNRPFLTNKTRWAGGLSVSFLRSVYQWSPTTSFATRYNTEHLWIGRAFALKSCKSASRIILTAGTSFRNYTYRPSTATDTLQVFSNSIMILGSAAFSCNNYFITDYLFEFGKVENLPHGRLFQLTVGQELNEFFQRSYVGINLSAGNFFRRVGYFQAYLKVGTYVRAWSLEDCVLKGNLNYFTPLMFFNNRKFRFRSFITGDYRTSFNLRPGNLDYYDAEVLFNIPNLKRSEAFYSTESLTASLATVIYTPWYFYGFRFALIGQIQAGVAAPRSRSLVNAPGFLGFGTGVMIKNNNLAFPSFLIAGYLYPISPDGVEPIQGTMSSVYRQILYNFNVTAPYTETLGN